MKYLLQMSALALLTSSAALAVTIVRPGADDTRVLRLGPQYHVVARGNFCGVGSDLYLIHDTATGGFFFRDISPRDVRVELRLPLHASTGSRVELALDLNGDRCTDLVVRDPLRNVLEAWVLQGPSVLVTSGIPVTDPRGATLLGLAPIEDGRPGLVVADPVSTETYAYLLSGPAWRARRLVGAGERPGYSALATGDWNGDGVVDLLWRELGSREYSVGFGQWNGRTHSFRNQPLRESGITSGFELVGSANIGGDRRPELVFMQPRGAPHGRVRVFGFSFRSGFIEDPGSNAVVNRALRERLAELGPGATIEVLADPGNVTGAAFVLPH